MIELPWLQMSGAIAGGLVGSFSGFIANSFHEHRVQVRVRRNIASALIGEIGALTHYVESNYLTLLRAGLQSVADGQDYFYHHFRGDRDYMPVFRAIGGSVGFLPSPMPRELVSWYTGLGTALERAHALHDLSARRDPLLRDYAVDLAKAQQAALMDLVATATPLLEALARL
jgi:hypothetical protein